jgi:transcriptional regulator with XRE-family HTH domain
MSPKTDPAVSREVAQRFGANLLRERKRADLSQEEVGFRAALHRTEVGMLERGIRLPRIDTLVKLTGALESSPDELLDEIVWVPLVVAQMGDFRVGSRAD